MAALPAGRPWPAEPAAGKQEARLARPRSAKEQAEYLTHFRADSIVADAELIRQRLTGGKPWSVLGQSFGAARIRGLRSWITGEYEHDGLSASRDRVLDRLIGMVRGTV